MTGFDGFTGWDVEGLRTGWGCWKAESSVFKGDDAEWNVNVNIWSLNILDIIANICFIIKQKM